MSKYAFTQTDLLRSILNLKCAAANADVLYITDRKNGLDGKCDHDKMVKMDAILFCLENYNYGYYAEDSINCLTIDEIAVLMQKGKQLSDECSCNPPTRPVTIPEFSF